MKKGMPARAAMQSGTVAVTHSPDGTWLIALQGEHDLNTGEQLAAALARPGEHPRVLVDLSECTFADTTVIHALILAHRQGTQRGGTLEVLIPAQASVARRLAALTHLAEILPLHMHPEASREYVRGAAS